MFKASKSTLQKVRPVVQSSEKTQAKNAGKMKVTPIGFAFVLGGLAFASYLFKPSKTSPKAAMDTFKPQIAIVFATGDNEGQFKKAAETLGFEYVDVSVNTNKLDELVKAGKTRFFIEGFKNQQALENIEQNVVQPDLLMYFGKTHDEAGLRVANITNASQIKDELERRNLL